VARLITDRALTIVTVWQEARGEPYETQVCVAETIRNRVRTHWDKASTVADVVLERYQFSGMNDANPWRGDSFELDDTDPVVIQCGHAADEAFTMNAQRSNGATMFLNEALTKKLNHGHLPPWFHEDRVVKRSGQLTFLR
jgi:hypothetical protein